MDIMPLNSHKRGLLIGAFAFLALASLPASHGESSDALTTAAPEAITNSKQQDTFYFDPPPFDKDVTEGQSVTLQCDVSNRNHIEFSWEVDNKKVVNTSRRFQADSDLRILRVDRGLDSGAFRCTATNVTTGVSLRSRGATLNIQWIADTAAVTLKGPRDEAALEEGVELSLKCEVEGQPEPSVEWFANHIRVFPTDRIRINKNRLRVSGVTVEDNGIFSCHAANDAGDVSSESDFMLNIAGADTAVLVGETFTRKKLVKKGEVASFDCQYENAILTEWYFTDTNQGDLRLNNRNGSAKYRIYSNGTLSVANVAKKDAGIYKCVGLSQSGPVQTFAAELSIAYLDDLTTASFQPRPPGPGFRPLVIPEQQKLEIQCIPPSGLPAPEQRWEYSWGLPIPATGRIKAERDILTITSAEPADSGNYSCVVSNTAGQTSKNVWVVVSVPPRLKQPPLSDRITEGQQASFTCHYEGTPYPVTSIIWKKGEFPVDTTHPRYVVDQEAAALTITDVRPGDEADYHCVVNTTGQPLVTSNNAHLYVEKRLKFKPVPVNTKLELSSSSKIHCNADARTPPLVRWKKGASYDLPSHIVDVDGTLFFEGVAYSDAGEYTCIAQTDTERINATIVVEIVIKPQFKVKPKNTTAVEGYPVMLHCVAAGDPPPEIQWDRNNRVTGFLADRFKLLPNGSLYIKEVYMEDVGKYGCTAGNSGGFQREEVYLHVARGDGVGSGNGADGRVYTADNGDDEANMVKTIVIAVCSAVAYLAIVIGLTVYCSLRMMKAKNLRKQMERDAAAASATGQDKAENGAVPTENTELMDKKDRDSSIVKSDMDARSHVSGVSSHPSHSSHPSQQSAGSRGLDRLNFPRHQLQTLGMLGKGHFGDVFLARAHMIREAEPETLVVVKSLLSRDERHQFEFRREMDLFSKLSHEHLVKLLGVCREMEPQFLITEYTDWGDLKQFLWATRTDNGKRNVKIAPLTPAQKVAMCRQVALALEHLAHHRVVHKDVAARNMLLSSRLDLKVACMALCRDVYATEYYPYRQQLVPLRWMPPETVFDDEYSTKSDVWSFGVFVWEVFTLGDLPYRDRQDEEVVKALKLPGECHLDPPPGCPAELVQLIAGCTRDCPAERPSFSEIVVAIGDMTVDSDV